MLRSDCEPFCDGSILQQYNTHDMCLPALISTYNRSDRVYPSNYHECHQRHAQHYETDSHSLKLETIPNTSSIQINRLILLASLREERAILRVSLRMERNLLRKLRLPGTWPLPRPRPTPQTPPPIPHKHRLASNPPHPSIPHLPRRLHNKLCLPVLVPVRLADVVDPENFTASWSTAKSESGGRNER